LNSHCQLNYKFSSFSAKQKLADTASQQPANPGVAAQGVGASKKGSCGSALLRKVHLSEPTSPIPVKQTKSSVLPGQEVGSEKISSFAYKRLIHPLAFAHKRLGAPLKVMQSRKDVLA